MQIKNRNGLAGWRKKKRPASAASSPADGTQQISSVAQSAANSASADNAPSPSAARPASELEKLYSAILNREGFTYDASADPAYQTYKADYEASGKRARADAEARAAALTGGYGSTYSAAAGQQEYDEYMRKLAAAVPELESAAYERYRAGGEALMDAYALAAEREQTEYDRAADEKALELSRAESERAYRQKLAEAEYARELEAAKTEYTRQKDERTMLTALIGKGYDPTDAELSAAGMTRAQSNSLLYEYYRSSKQAAPEALKAALGITSAPAASSGGGSAALKKVKETVREMESAGASEEVVNTYIARQATAGLITVVDARKLMTIGNR